MIEFRYNIQKWGDEMAYSELIKNFERIRDYMREFYVYGFKTVSYTHLRAHETS